MSTHSFDSASTLQRALADELAAHFSTPAGARALAALQVARALDDDTNDVDTDSVDVDRTADGASGVVVGPYLLGADGVCRRRALSAHEETRWADVEVIAAKGHRRRVVVVGESVARGYLYDPAVSFADVVAAQLGADFEVVDLAHTDHPTAAMLPLCVQALALKPDVLVLFAGNNTTDARPALARLAVGGAGVDDVLAAFAAVHTAHVGAVVEQLTTSFSSLCEQAGVRGVVVVPLANTRTFDAVGEAVAVGAQGQIPRARPRSVVDDDAGHEAVANLPTSGFPGLTASARRRMLAAPLAVTVARVDVGQVLDDARLDGFSAFVDYCHLSLAAMQAVAVAIANTLDVAPSTAPLAPLITDADHARVWVLAALHNSHNGQPRHILEGVLQQAFVLDATSATSLLLDVLAIKLDEAPRWAAPAYARVLEHPVAARLFDAVRPEFDDKYADTALLQAARACFVAYGRIEAAAALDALVVRTRVATDLLHHTRCRPRHAARLTPAMATRGPVLAVYAAALDIELVLPTTTTSTTIAAVVRATGLVRVLCDGVDVGVVVDAAVDSWSRGTIDLGPLAAGLHVVTLVFEPPVVDLAGFRDNVIASIRRGEVPTPFAVFARLAALQLQGAAP